MLQRALVTLAVVLGAVALTARPAGAGGWAVVTLDSVPVQARAEEALRLGFMVRQHGVTPVDAVKPYLSATRAGTNETVQAEAQKDGVVGHFVVEVTFPSAGAWQWEITPEPFAGTRFEPLKVMPAGADSAEQAKLTPSAADEGALASLSATRSERVVEAGALRWFGAGLLVLAAGLALTTRRTAIGRRFAQRSR